MTTLEHLDNWLDRNREWWKLSADELTERKERMVAFSEENPSWSWPKIADYLNLK